MEPESKRDKEDRRAEKKAKRREAKLDAYDREDRVGANQESRRLIAEHPLELDEVQSELVRRLRADGIAHLDFAELFSDDLWHTLRSDAWAFAREIERDLDA